MRKVAVLYVHPLFGEGIARLLDGEEGMQAVRIDVREPDAPRLIEQLQPDMVILEGSARDLDLLGLFQALPDALVVCVSLGDNEARVYRGPWVTTATPETLRDLIRDHKPRTDGGPPLPESRSPRD